ncbi:hypothetical protein GOODEAATRI_002273 [Goodea atripinnis]|uniref:Uncharacterized protein n=1 Tax=Goodea atripinnis TaxID=208336 RepID=A0ABV0PKK7_9TELE
MLYLVCCLAALFHATLCSASSGEHYYINCCLLKHYRCFLNYATVNLYSYELTSLLFMYLIPFFLYPRVTEEESTATTMEALKARIRELEKQILRGDRYKCLICMVSITSVH